MTARARPNLGRLLHQSLIYGLLLLLAVVILLPISWLLISSLKPDAEYLAYPIHILPETPAWSNYIEVFTYPGVNFMKHASNSLYLALTYSSLSVVTSAMGGFAFARFRGVPGHGRVFGVVIILLIIPAIVFTIPQFLLFSFVRLTNTYWPWILTGLAANAYSIFLFRQFFAGIPKELEDAAEIDGCGPFRMFWDIFLPNAKPALATAFIFSFSGVWSDVVQPLLYLSASNTTLAVRIMDGYTTPRGTPLNTLGFAAAVIYALPLVVMFFFAQRHILKGVVTSGFAGR